MNKNNYFIIEVLGCRIHVFFDKKWRDIARKIIKGPLRTDNTLVEPDAIALHDGNDYYILAAPNAPNKTIYHECFHVFMWMADDYNFLFDVDNQEPMAYLFSYIIDETLKLKKKQGKKK